MAFHDLRYMFGDSYWLVRVVAALTMNLFFGQSVTASVSTGKTRPSRSQDRSARASKNVLSSPVTFRANRRAGIGTGEANIHRRRVDRLANAAIPVVFTSLLVGSALSLAVALDLEPSAVPPGPATTHLLAAGAAAVLVFAVGFRLVPRLLVVSVRPSLVGVVLLDGVTGPALLAVDFRGETLFLLGAALQAIALLGFAIAIADLVRRSDRRRVGWRAILGAAACAALVALLGLTFAFAPASSVPATAFDAHYRLEIGGLLGLTIVGVTYYFYPSAIASTAGIGDRTARWSVTALLGGLGLEISGSLASVSPLVGAGRWLSILGAALYAAVLWTIFLERLG